MRTVHICAALAALALAAPAEAQYRMEWGMDASAVGALGDVSSFNLTFPAARIRLGFFRPGARIEPETGVGFSYTKVEDIDGVWRHDVQVAALYHFRPVRADAALTAESFSPYLRPFLGFTGVNAGDDDELGDDNDDSDVILGVGLGTRLRWRQDLAWRFEGNVGYGFDNEALRLELLAGLSFFPR